MHQDVEIAFSDVPEDQRARIEQFVVGLQPRLVNTYEATKMDRGGQLEPQEAPENQDDPEAEGPSGQPLPEALQPFEPNVDLGSWSNAAGYAGLDDDPSWTLFQDESTFIDYFDPLVDPTFLQPEVEFPDSGKENPS